MMLGVFGGSAEAFDGGGVVSIGAESIFASVSGAVILPAPTLVSSEGFLTYGPIFD
jgi:hypothetical protein